MKPSEINHVVAARIITLTEIQTRFERLKRFMSNWQTVIAVSLALFTAKIGAEQLLELLMEVYEMNKLLIILVSLIIGIVIGEYNSCEGSYSLEWGKCSYEK